MLRRAGLNSVLWSNEPSATAALEDNMSSLKNDETEINLLALLPDDYDSTPKIGNNVKPSDIATFLKVTKGALRKVPHCDPSMRGSWP